MRYMCQVERVPAEMLEVVSKPADAASKATSSVAINDLKPGEQVEIITMGTLFDQILNDLALDWIAYNEQSLKRLETILMQLGAIVSLKDFHETVFIRFDVLISALKVHGYSFGDMTILDDQLSKSLDFIDVESREILKALAAKGKQALQSYLEKLAPEAQ